MKCQSCGADIFFDPASQLLVCGYCGNREDPKTIGEQGKIKAGENGESYIEAEEFLCSQCGAKILSTDETAMTFCSYCGSSIELEGRLTEERRPDYIIPFMKTKAECEALYRAKVRRALYAPREMKTEDTVSKFRGIYMPYWVYTMRNRGGLSANGTRTERRGDYVYTYHYNVSAPYSAEYSGISYDAASSFSDSLSEAIAPFDARQKTEFNTAYMSGFYADTRDVQPYVYMTDANKTVAGDIARQAMNASPEFSKHGVSSGSIEKSVALSTDPKSGYFPVWFLAIRSKDRSRVSYAVVNGQTGRVAVDLPIDITKYLLGSLILALPIFVILNLFLTMTPGRMIIAAIIIGIITLITASSVINRQYVRENQLDDKGLMYVRDETPNKSVFAKFKESAAKRAPQGVRVKTTWKIWAGIALSLLVAFIAPTYDYQYYIAVFIQMGLNVWAILDVIRAYNLLSTRKPPQFGARGGDEHA